jgi:hypothetical protein
MSRYWDTQKERWIYPSPPPSDFAAPKWGEARKVHDWRNYISERLRSMWDDFTVDQRSAIAESAQEIADREEWD